MESDFRKEFSSFKQNQSKASTSSTGFQFKDFNVPLLKNVSLPSISLNSNPAVNSVSQNSNSGGGGGGSWMSSVQNRSYALTYGLMSFGGALLMTMIMFWSIPLIVLRPSKFMLLYVICMVLLYVGYLFMRIAYGSSRTFGRAMIDTIYDTSGDGRDISQRINYGMVGNAVMILLMLYGTLVLQSQIFCVFLIVVQFSGVFLFIGRLVCGTRMSLVTSVFQRSASSFLPL
ncbi:hypothetical protein MP228_001671 [Amoeboaphelidium protococcarum]|nr:hypothetical protein MP228_001671 [Amoeboaphelidium protococcarum]